jgi:hypothetical protein
MVHGDDDAAITEGESGHGLWLAGWLREGTAGGGYADDPHVSYLISAVNE